jgi:ketosteroid isomerase-like protein
MPRNPQDVAKDILRYFSEGVEAPGLFTDPYTAWHCYDGVDKISRPRLLNVGQPTPSSFDRPKNEYERVETYGADGAVTCLLTSKLTMADGRVVRLHSCMVHHLNDAGQVYRVEAYYDPQQLERDSWYREHLKMYQGVASGQNPYRP